MVRLLPLLFILSISLADTKTVAISYFDNTSGTKEYDPLSKGLSDMLITDLSNVKSLKIVEREKLESLLKEIELGDGKFIDPNTAQKLGKGLGASFMLTGSFLIMGETMRIDARLVDVGTGEVTMAEEITGEKYSFFELEKVLKDKLIKSLNIELSRTESRKVKKSQTESFEAFNNYSSSIDAFDKGDYEKSMSFMKIATGIDDDFDIAWDKLEDLEILLDDLIKRKSLGFGDFYNQFFTAIDNIKMQKPNSCEKFNFLIQDKLAVQGNYNKSALDDAWWLMVQYTNAYGNLRGTDKALSEVYKENLDDFIHTNGELPWIDAGYSGVPKDFADCKNQFGNMVKQLFQFIDFVLDVEFENLDCIYHHPKEVVIDLAMKQIEMLFNLVYMTGKENDYENGLAFSVNDGKTFNKNIIDNYGEYFIKYGSKLYTLFPNTSFKRYASIVQFYIDRKK